MPDDLVVEATQIESVAITCCQLLAKRLDLPLPSGVGERLAGPADVPVGLGLGLQLAQSSS